MTVGLPPGCWVSKISDDAIGDKTAPRGSLLIATDPLHFHISENTADTVAEYPKHGLCPGWVNEPG